VLKHLNIVGTAGAFLVITITELRYAALTLTLMNIEKGLLTPTSKKRVRQDLNAEPAAYAVINSYLIWIHSRITKREKGTCSVDNILVF